MFSGQFFADFGFCLNYFHNFFCLTIVTLVWLFSVVCFQMSPQIACLRRGKVTLAAFVRLFSTVYFHMIPQRACIIWSKVTLAAFFYFSRLCVFKWALKWLAWGSIVALVAFIGYFSLNFLRRKITPRNPKKCVLNRREGDLWMISSRLRSFSTLFSQKSLNEK